MPTRKQQQQFQADFIRAFSGRGKILRVLFAVLIAAVTLSVLVMAPGSKSVASEEYSSVRYTSPVRGASIPVVERPVTTQFAATKTSHNQDAAPASAEHGWAVVNVDALNVRESPRIDAAILTVIPEGTCVEQLSVQPEWAMIQREPGIPTGWSWREYLTLVDSCPSGTTALGAVVVPVVVPTRAASVVVAQPAENLVPFYALTKLAPNTSTNREVWVYECFGEGSNGMRSVPARTPMELLGTGLYQPAGDQLALLGTGPYAKVRFWDGQVGWTSADAIASGTDGTPLLSGNCEEYDRVNWSSVVRPTFTPYPTATPAYGGGATRSNCCKICTTGKACGNSCISRSYTCHQGAGCACNG